MTQRIDFSPLTIDVPAGEARAFNAAVSASVPTAPSRARGFGFAVDLIGLFGLVPAELLFFPLFISTLVGSILEPSAQAWSLTLLLFVVNLGAVAIIWWLAKRYVRPLRSRTTWIRLDRFARANNLRFAPWSAAPKYPSAFFAVGADLYVYDHVSSIEGPFFDLGNFAYQVGRRGAESVEHRRGFVAVHLDHAVDQFVLDARSDDVLGFSSLPIAVPRDQRVELEGDFARSFTLYAPAGRERAALELFDSTMLGTIADLGVEVDLETNGEWLFAYSRKPFDMSNATTVQSLFAFVDVVGGKFRQSVERLTEPASAAGVVTGSPFARSERTLQTWARDPRVLVYGVVLAFFGVFAGAIAILNAAGS